MLTRADELASLTVLDSEGIPIALSSLWRERPIVLAFVRHFGCLLCRDHVVELAAGHAEVRAAGAELVVIGNGSPSFIAGFRDQTGWQGPLYTDPSLASFRAAQLKRGVGRTFDPRALGKTLEALARGARPGLTQGDQWQQGGVVIVAPTGEVRWHHISQRSGDNARLADILAALR